MPSSTLTRQRTPLDDFPVDAFQDFAEFVRHVAPRWLDGSRSLNQLTMRRARLREMARGRRRGYCVVSAPPSRVGSDRALIRRRR
ncbi:MAG: hypothetical protein WAQ05_04865 [Rubrivivax sp.]